MITPSFGLTSTERVLPKLALDFTTASLDSRITFTRTTSAFNPATYTNSSGVIIAASNDQPRFDYDSVTLVCKGLLIEESRTNLATGSNDFDNTTYWTKGRVTITSESVIAPDGSATSLKTNQIAGQTTLGGVIKQFTTSATSYTLSVFAKKAEKTFLALATASSTSPSARTWFNLDTGQIATNAVSNTASITAYKNGWYKCSITRTLTAAITDFTIYSTNTDNTTIVTDSGGIYIWGAQLEAGAFATSYIPTTTAALTRNADVAVMTGTNFSDWYNVSEGAFGCLVLPKAASGVKPVLQCDDATALNTIVIQGNATATEMKITTLAVLQNTLSTGTITANAQYGLCGAWSTGSDALSKSGASPSTGSPITIPTVTQARLGSDGTNYFNGWLKKVNYWPQHVTNSETQAFSK